VDHSVEFSVPCRLGGLHGSNALRNEQAPLTMREFMFEKTTRQNVLKDLLVYADAVEARE
jgi:hypothetical protein